MIVAGIGCRRGATAAEVEAAIQAALARGRSGAGHDRTAIATSDGKARRGRESSRQRRHGARASCWSAPAELEAAAQRGRNPHPRSAKALAGVPSVAEAAALAAAGPSAQAASLPRTCDRRRSPARSPKREDTRMTVHFIGAGPGAADLITCAGATSSRAARSASMPARSCRARCSLLPARRAHRRYRAAVARRDRGRVRGGARGRP